MKKSVLFLVHGMGVHDDKGEWAKPAVAVLKRAFKRYRHSRHQYSMEDKIDIVPISYDHIFRKTVEAWQDNASKITKAVSGTDGIEAAEIVSWLSDSGVRENNEQWTHAADVALYRAIPTIRDEVKIHVANQIASRVIDMKASEGWGVIAHSLGTIVAHDSLHMLWSGEAPGAIEHPLSPKHNKAQFVAMVSNVSRLLETDVDVYESTVAPGRGKSNRYGCYSYLNINHELDPFSVPRRFNPLDWPDREAKAEHRYQDIRLQHIHGSNIHSLEHYLLHPEVHIPILRGLMFSTFVNKNERQAAIDRFPKFGSNGRDWSLALRESVIERLPAESDVWPILKRIWEEFSGDLIIDDAA